MPIKTKFNETNTFSKHDLLLVSVILVLALTLRLYKVNTPLADWHSWRQADTAAVARNFVRSGFNLLRPQYDDLSNIQSGQDNPEGLRLVEFPLYNSVFGLLYKYLPVLPLEVYGRAVSIFFSLVTIVVIYYLMFKEDGRIGAFFASLIFAVFPFFVYYSRVVLPEMMAMGLMFVAIALTYRFSHTKKETLGTLFTIVLAAIFAGLAILTKPTVGFYGISVIYLLFFRNGFSFVKKPYPYLFAVFVLLPFGLWRWWAHMFPQGIPYAQWLFTSVNTSTGLQNIFFRPAFFRWIFYERILLLILGGYATVFFVLGVLKKQKKSLLMYSIFISALVYLFVFQGGNVQHDYYQITILPALAIGMGAGISLLFQHKNLFLPLPMTIIAIVGILGFSWITSYERIRPYYNYSKDLVSMATIINTLTPPDSQVVTDSTGDTTLLYLSDRRGYPAVTGDLHFLAAKGLDYFVTMNGSVAKEVAKEFDLIFENEKMFLFKL